MTLNLRPTHTIPHYWLNKGRSVFRGGHPCRQIRPKQHKLSKTWVFVVQTCGLPLNLSYKSWYVLPLWKFGGYLIYCQVYDSKLLHSAHGLYFWECVCVYMCVFCGSHSKHWLLRIKHWLVFYTRSRNWLLFTVPYGTASLSKMQVNYFP